MYGKKRRDFMEVFGGSDAGKRVLGEIYKMCGYNSQLFSTDPQTTAFNAGKHRIAQGISSILNQKEEHIHEAMQFAQQVTIRERKVD